MGTFKQWLNEGWDDNTEIRGEYWIIDGYVDFADGDVGDRNHEMIAFSGVIGHYADAIFSLAEELEIEVDNQYGFDGEDTEAVTNALQAIEEKLSEEKGESGAIAAIMQSLGCDQPAYLILSGFGDAREYVIDHWGWIAVRSNNVELSGYDKSRQEEIARAVSEIYTKNTGKNQIQPRWNYQFMISKLESRGM